jgi:hypothetical protein
MNMVVSAHSNSDFVDFGADQLDIKKKMKSKLGPNITLRLKFNQYSGDAVGSKGYELVATGDNEPVVSLEMVGVSTDTPVATTGEGNVKGVEL